MTKKRQSEDEIGDGVKGQEKARQAGKGDGAAVSP